MKPGAIDTFLRREMDLLDAKTSRHTGSASSSPRSDAAVLLVSLKVKDGAGGGYWWVECGSCDAGWQVTHYAESVG